MSRTQEECSICGMPIEGFANDAEPINGGRCCAVCRDHVVIPARIRKQRKEREQQERELGSIIDNPGVE
jgi:hypothetical protein